MISLDFCESIFDQSIKRVLPKSLIRASLSISKKKIKVDDHEYTYSGKLCAFGFGKAAVGMINETINIIGDKLDHVICCSPTPTKEEIRDHPDLFRLREVKKTGKQPLVEVFHGPRTNQPDEEVVRSSLSMAKLASKLKEGDLLLVCITGGGSAMLTLPNPVDKNTDPLDASAVRIPLQAIVEVSKLLSLGGASIQEINSVRSCLDAMKAGGLASFASPAQVISLILSDVIGDPLEFIASGPTYIGEPVSSNDQPNPIGRAQQIIDKYQIRSKIPDVVRKFFDVRSSETSQFSKVVYPKPGNHIIGNITMALKTAADALAAYSPPGASVEPCSVSKEILPRTPVTKYTCMLPVLLSDSMAGEMFERTTAVADLAWHLRTLMQIALQKPTFGMNDISTDLKNAIKIAHRATIQPAKHDYYDLIYAVLEICKQIRRQSGRAGGPRRSVCLVFGGEATVKIAKNVSKPINGGRCSHAALAAALRWYQLKTELTATPKNVPSVYLNFFARATDGLDGPSAYGAGAWSSHDLITDEAVAEKAKVCLQCGDSYGFYDDLIKARTSENKLYLPGSLTGTNVMDLFLCAISVE